MILNQSEKRLLLRPHAVSSAAPITLFYHSGLIYICIHLAGSGSNEDARTRPFMR
jgi:hypothetical protein